MKVPDISVETIVGHLPQLPHTIPGAYRDGAKGPKVRVIWPSPVDNRITLEVRVVPYSKGKRLLQARDITRLQQLETIRRDFVANVSHEIKTPLTAIKGYVETLYNREVDSSEDTHRFLGIVIKHVNRLESIVEDLLALSRIERENFREALNLATVRLENICQTAIQVCQKNAEAKRIAIDVQCGEDLQATVDATLLEQAIVNLLDNAIKYSDTGSCVTVTLTLESGSVRCCVCDQGTGIPAAELPRLFDRFHRFQHSGTEHIRGAGLGLALVDVVARRHGGRVDVESEQGRGSCFCLLIPYHADKKTAG